MIVIKRNNKSEPVHFDKITQRIKKLINPIELQNINLPYLDISKEEQILDPILIAQKVVGSIYSGISTEILDLEAAEICINLSTINPSYAYLGGRILISNLQKKLNNDSNSFSNKIKVLFEETKLIDSKFYNFVMDNKEYLNNIINYNRDYLYDYFGYKTLEKAYLLKSNNKIMETPQDMLLRTAITLNNISTINLELIKETYDYMSLGYYIHASPTLFNSGTINPQLSSCFLLGTNDSLDSITETWNSCAQISKWAGGIGLHVSNIRSKNSLIKSTNGLSNGLVPFLQVFNYIARWIDQGGRRPGSIAIYLEPHHPDIFEFLDLRKNFGAETERARDLFYALWISDLFMKQVENNDDWYLLNADICDGLPDVYGEEYEKLYWQYVNENKYKSKIKARTLWMAILDTQIETGMPYIGFKDHVNKKCNQKNLGTIKSSNLCHEITQFSNHDEYGVCNLASISIKSFIKPYIFNKSDEWKIYSKLNCKYCTYAKEFLKYNNVNYKEIFNYELPKGSTYPQIFINDDLIGGWTELYKFTAATFDYDKLYKVAYIATVNLNKVIDINYYPIIQAKRSNFKHRPIGLGIQGLADALVLMKINFDSDESLEFNEKIMETIYLASMTASNDLAIERYEDIKLLINHININKLSYPEYYDEKHNLTNIEMNKLYHKLRPNKCELILDINKTFIGGYSTFENSPLSEGKFQFDLWNKEPKMYKDKWNLLREKIIKYGTRNSLLTALMPTASTSQILGNNECFEFFTNNIYTRKTQAGDFVLVNKYLINDLIKINIWSPELKNKIIYYNGSIQNINEIPLNIKELYKNIWEIKQVWVLNNALKRSPYVDQAQSMNIFIAKPDYQRLNSSHFWAWHNGLKTGMYYLRTRPAANPIKFTIDPSLEKTCESCTA